MSETNFTNVLIILEIVFSLAVLRVLGKAGGKTSMLIFIGTICAAWLATMYTLIKSGFFTATGMPQLSFTVAVIIPVILGYLAVRLFKPLRHAVASLTTVDFLHLQYWRSAFGILFFFTAALPM